MLAIIWWLYQPKPFRRSFSQFEFHLLLCIYSNFPFSFEQIKTQLLTLIYYIASPQKGMAGRHGTPKSKYEYDESHSKRFDGSTWKYAWVSLKQWSHGVWGFSIGTQRNKRGFQSNEMNLMTLCNRWATNPAAQFLLSIPLFSTYQPLFIDFVLSCPLFIRQTLRISAKNELRPFLVL